MKFYLFTAKTCKILIGAFATFVTVVATLVLVSWQISVKGTELVDNTSLLKHRQVLVEEASHLAAVLEETADQRAALSDLVLSSDDSEVVSFLSYLDELSRRLGVELQTANLNIEKSEGSDFSALVLQVTVDGPDEKVVDMLNLFETIPYQIQLNGVTLVRPIDDNSAKATLTLLVTVRSN